MKDDHSSKRRRLWKPLAVLALVFSLGAVSGIGGVALVMKHRLREMVRHPQLYQGPGDRAFERIHRDLAKNLDLTPEEAAALRGELEVARDELRELRVALLDDVRGVVRDTLTRMEAHLPEPKREALRRQAAERLEPWGLDPDGP